MPQSNNRWLSLRIWRNNTWIYVIMKCLSLGTLVAGQREAGAESGILCNVIYCKELLYFTLRTTYRYWCWCWYHIETYSITFLLFSVSIQFQIWLCGNYSRTHTAFLLMRIWALFLPIIHYIYIYITELEDRT